MVSSRAVVDRVQEPDFGIRDSLQTIIVVHELPQYTNADILFLKCRRLRRPRISGWPG